MRAGSGAISKTTRHTYAESEGVSEVEVIWSRNLEEEHFLWLIFGPSLSVILFQYCMINDEKKIVNNLIIDGANVLAMIDYRLFEETDVHAFSYFASPLVSKCHRGEWLTSWPPVGSSESEV